MGRVRLDLAGVHHDPDPLSHGLRKNKYEDDYNDNRGTQVVSDDH